MMNDFNNDEVNEMKKSHSSEEENTFEADLRPDTGAFIPSFDSDEEGIHNAILSEKSFDDLASFIKGITSDVPESVNKIINNLADKLSLTLGLSVACTTSRQAHLSRFLEETEQALFSPENFNSLDSKQQMELYKLAAKTQGDLIETTRKTVAQNKELFAKETGTIQQLMNKLVALSPEKQQALLQALDDEETSEDVAEDTSEETGNSPDSE